MLYHLISNKLETKEEYNLVLLNLLELLLVLLFGLGLVWGFVVLVLLFVSHLQIY